MYWDATCCASSALVIGDRVLLLRARATCLGLLAGTANRSDVIARFEAKRGLVGVKPSTEARMERMIKSRRKGSFGL